MVDNLAYTAISAIVSTCFLLVLLLLSLWHNLVSAHFRGKRSQKAKSSPSEPNSKSHFRAPSAGSETPLGLGGSDSAQVEAFTIPNTNFGVQDNDKSETAKSQQDILSGTPFADVLNAENLKLVPSLKFYFEEYGITVEELEVQTADGFIIDLWHLKPKSGTNTSNTSKSKHPMLLLHGLLQSAGSFASGGRKSLAYHFHECGFDVWLGNNRCGFKPKWNNSVVERNKRWDWDMREMVKYDLRALVTTVLHETGRDKLTLVAHSQGTTQGFMGLANGKALYDDDFSLLDKIENFVALAPAVYPGPLLEERFFVRFMSKFIDAPAVFGLHSFLPLMMSMRSILVGSKLFSYLSYVMFNYLFDWDDELWDKPLRDRHFLFSPINISVKLMQWWLSLNKFKYSFKTYSAGIFPEMKTWFPSREESPRDNSPLHSNQERLSTEDFPRILMFIPKHDRLVDGDRLIKHFVHYEPHSLYKIWYLENYSHLDVLWAHDVIETVGREVVSHIRVSS